MNRFTLRSIVVLAAGFVVLAARPALAKDGPGPARKISAEEAKMDPEMGGRIDPLVKASIDRGDMSGCVVLIGRKAGIVFEKAYGNRQVEPPVEPIPELLRAYRAREPWCEGRLIITPHSAFFTPEAWADTRLKAAETMRAALLGPLPQNVITPEMF
mgnify:CR=1 FL=1